MVLITEQLQAATASPHTPDEARSAKTTRRDARGIHSNSEADNEDRLKRSGKSPLVLDVSVETEPDTSEIRKKPSLLRSKGIDPLPLLQSPSDYEAKLERKKSQSTQFSKTNAQYHKLFKEVSKDELLRQSYTCALQKDILYQGKMYVSENWICFHSKVFGKDTKIAIPVLLVTFIKKTKTAILVPNALVITTSSSERHVFVSFLSRDTTFKFLKTICVHLDGENVGSSPAPSSAESSFRATRPSSLPLDFTGDFADLDGVVRQRRQDMLESSSSGSQTPDYEKMAEFPSLPQNFLNGQVAVHADIHRQQTPDPKHTPHRNGLAPAMAATHDQKPSQTVSLNTLLFIYLFLVCVLVLSSCYMAFKIVALEQRLNSLRSLTEFPHNENILHQKSQTEFSAEIYGELSTNLFKLEKIQKNLQKLLEET
ncbi:GRAM domain-containing protein 2B [Brienomyrus brachyistius]|uniref:GRAM domain-containing protein 2B n=1 Tax=Brienomyrus brachyistius TaxID=42636 RepID=UPI0020B39C1F|nr:GRAM domain-containing protein 2B [Brienomyrus brachyistius]